MKSFGEIEELLPAPAAVGLPNAHEFHDNEWFVRFAVRNDSIVAYTDPALKKVSFLQNCEFFHFDY